MRRAADLHIHSRHSIATSPKLTPPHLDRWARIKGLDLVGTGDCTHPTWLAGLREALEPAEEGLFRLKGEIRRSFDSGQALAEGLPEPGVDREVRFVLTGEISTIYSRDGRTRKVHHLVLLPGFEAAYAFQVRLERVGNISSDGRPILGLDSRDLFGLLLDADPRAVLVPAHIWTPWFSALGERSGFDSIDECYGDLAPRITAVETGLSSNPPMNWAVSALDRYSIISNSDAHSPEKLGREATILDMEDSWEGLSRALSGGGPAGRILETVEFYPQEGKYHADGHRACGVVRLPGEASEGPCPVCGKPLTPGVLGRVARLADRPVDESAPCPPDSEGTNRRPYRSLVPLKEILSEIAGVGEGTRAVTAAYAGAVREAGSEFALLLDLDRRGVESLHIPGISGELLAEAVDRMRSGRIYVRPGYDGEYGEIRVFAPSERISPRTEAGLFGPEEVPGGAPSPQPRPPCPAGQGKSGKPRRGAAPEGGEPLVPPAPETCGPAPETAPGHVGSGLEAFGPGGEAPDPNQVLAVSHPGGPALVLAGPGTGKTAVLTRRIARVLESGEDPRSVLALTFTNKAARELRDRLERVLGPGPARTATASTFHAFCLSLLRENAAPAGLPEGFAVLGEEERDALLVRAAGKKARAVGAYAEARKRCLLLPGERTPRLGPGAPAGLSDLLRGFESRAYDAETDRLYAAYRAELRTEGAVDFDDLVSGAVRLLSAKPEILADIRRRYRFVYVDEYQDVNLAQYALVRVLAPGSGGAGADPEAREGGPDPRSPAVPQELFVIGDPDQSIYSFRGADPRFIARFRTDYPDAKIYSLTRSWRCAPAILGAAGRISGSPLEGSGASAVLERREAPTDASEAEGIAREIDRLIGGTRFFALDSGIADGDADPAAGQTGGAGGRTDRLRGLSECAILVRTAAQFPALEKALRDHGIPCRASGGGVWWEDEPARSILRLLRRARRPDPGDGEPLAELRSLSPAEAVRAAAERASSENAAGGRGASRRGSEETSGERLAELAAGFSELDSLLDALALRDSAEADRTDSGDLRGEAVRLLTIHAAKGLEFDHVFVAGLEEGILPFTLYEAEQAPEDLEARIGEERRLLYVAVTRARVGLHLWRARSRTFRGRKLALPPSRFLAEIEDLVPRADEAPRPRPDPQLGLFPKPARGRP